MMLYFLLFIFVFSALLPVLYPSDKAFLDLKLLTEIWTLCFFILAVFGIVWLLTANFYLNWVVSQTLRHLTVIIIIYWIRYVDYRKIQNYQGKPLWILSDYYKNELCRKFLHKSLMHIKPLLFCMSNLHLYFCCVVRGQRTTNSPFLSLETLDSGGVLLFPPATLPFKNSCHHILPST